MRGIPGMAWFCLLFALWFAFDGWIYDDPEMAPHRPFNRAGALVMAGFAAAFCLLAVRVRRFARLPRDPEMPPHMPPDCDRWNWGAFLLAPFWSIGNGVYWGVLSVLPYVGIVLQVYLGIRGNRHAWERTEWGSSRQFAEVQRAWGLCALWVVMLWLGLGTLAYAVTRDSLAGDFLVGP